MQHSFGGGSVARSQNEGEQNMPPLNMSLWHIDYFELKLSEKQPGQEGHLIRLKFLSVDSRHNVVQSVINKCVEYKDACLLHEFRFHRNDLFCFLHIENDSTKMHYSDNHCFK